MGGLSTTLIDSLDMLAVLNDSQGFTEGVNWVLHNIKNFDKDANVSVFETNIRILGGLLSAHLIAANKTLNMYRGSYDGGLLALAVDLADRLLVAFDTPTRLPFGTVNLRRGVPKGESRIVCAACAATFSLEFGLLSALTGNGKYEATAKEAAEVLWSKRGAVHGLLSTHLEIDHGSWVLQASELCGVFRSLYLSYKRNSRRRRVLGVTLTRLTNIFSRRGRRLATSGTCRCSTSRLRPFRRLCEWRAKTICITSIPI